MERIKLFLMIISSLLLLSFSTLNYPEGIGKGLEKQNFNNNISTVPPGLQDKAMPHGLEKQGKVPPGWSKGKKTGWSKEFKHHHKHPLKVKHQKHRKH